MMAMETKNEEEEEEKGNNRLEALQFKKKTRVTFCRIARLTLYGSEKMRDTETRQMREATHRMVESL